MSEHFNDLTPAEAERLALLAEECGEVIQMVGKVLRHGYRSHHPSIIDGPDNRGLLEREIGDVQAIVRLMTNAGDLSPGRITNAAADKPSRMARYLHHQERPFAADPWHNFYPDGAANELRHQFERRGRGTLLMPAHVNALKWLFAEVDRLTAEREQHEAALARLAKLEQANRTRSDEREVATAAGTAVSSDVPDG